jgi:phospholipid/cholesterol/gamma-HCH transport system substrate-binding protein
MDDKAYRFGVGVLVLASSVIGIILIFFFGAIPNFWIQHYTCTINFAAAPGVEIDTPVRKSGVRIGRVVGVKLQDDDGGVNLTLELEKRYPIRAGEVARIQTGSLITGDAVIEFLPPNRTTLVNRFDGVGGGQKDGQLQPEEQEMAAAYLKDQDYLTGGEVAKDPLDSVLAMQENFSATLGSIDEAGKEIAILARDVRSLMGTKDGSIQSIIKKSELTIDNFNQTLDTLESILGDPKLKEALIASIEQFPDLVKNSGEVLQQTKLTLKNFEKVGTAAESALQNADEAISNITEITDPIAERAPEAVDDILRTVDNLDALLLDLRQFAARINSSNGTVSRLIEDDQLYIQLVQTLENVENLTARLQPIVQDVRIFSDKIARDPRQLGVRGALDARGSGLGIK